jgi:hypothetical protein
LSQPFGNSAPHTARSVHWSWPTIGQPFCDVLT